MPSNPAILRTPEPPASKQDIQPINDSGGAGFTPVIKAL